MSLKADLLAENRALYLPAISETFARFVHKGSLTQALPFAASDLDFLAPNSPAFSYPFALYSAGQAAPLSDNTPPTPCMVTQRDRGETIVLGDSGGFQIQTGAIDFDRQKTTPRMMRWMEQVSDWSMVLDFPTGGIAGGAMVKHGADLRAEGHDLDAMSKVNGLSVDYNACLVQTKINNDRFVAERTPGATRFLNVLQGRNETESKFWFDAVKHYPFEGWAFAGAHQNHFSLLLRRLLDMRNEGLLQTCGWLHVLGVSTLPIGCLLTAVQRAVREFVNPDFQISFDSASPFKSAANHGIMIGSTLDDHGWAIHYVPLSSFDAAENDRPLSDLLCERLDAMADTSPRRRHPAQTAIAGHLKLGDLRDAGGMKISGDGYHLLMHHNVEATIRAHRAAHDVMFEADPIIHDPVLIPVRIKTIEAMIRMAFSGEVINGKPLADPYGDVLSWAPWLDALAA